MYFEAGFTRKNEERLRNELKGGTIGSPFSMVSRAAGCCYIPSPPTSRHSNSMRVGTLVQSKLSAAPTVLSHCAIQ